MLENIFEVLNSSGDITDFEQYAVQMELEANAIINNDNTTQALGATQTPNTNTAMMQLGDSHDVVVNQQILNQLTIDTITANNLNATSENVPGANMTTIDNNVGNDSIANIYFNVKNLPIYTIDPLDLDTVEILQGGDVALDNAQFNLQKPSPLQNTEINDKLIPSSAVLNEHMADKPHILRVDIIQPAIQEISKENERFNNSPVMHHNIKLMRRRASSTDTPLTHVKSRELALQSCKRQLSKFENMDEETLMKENEKNITNIDVNSKLCEGNVHEINGKNNNDSKVEKTMKPRIKRTKLRSKKTKLAKETSLNDAENTHGIGQI